MWGLGCKSCVWVPVSLSFSKINIRDAKTVEVEHSGTIGERVVERQTKTQIGQSFGLGPLSVGYNQGVQWDPVTLSSQTSYSTPDNTPAQVNEVLNR